MVRGAVRLGADAYRRHCAETGLDKVVDAALSGLDPGADAAGIETAVQAVQAVQAELTSREMGADLAGLITGAYEELSFRRLGINVPAAVRGSAIGEDSGDGQFRRSYRLGDLAEAAVGAPSRSAR